MMDLFREGGFIMYPLLICSLLVWAIAIEKIISLKRFQAEINLLYEKAKPLLMEKKINEAKGLSHTVQPYISTPYKTLFESPDLDREQWENKMGRRLSETQLETKRLLWLVGTIGSSAPFIGLFGTVVGIIKSFEAIAETSRSGFSVVAAGLSEALIATAAGILVAVMAVFVYNYFQNKVGSVNLVFKNKLEDLEEVL